VKVKEETSGCREDLEIGLAVLLEARTIHPIENVLNSQSLD
jgi:hypothetical protein